MRPSAAAPIPARFDAPIASKACGAHSCRSRHCAPTLAATPLPIGQLTPVPPALGGRLPGVPAYYTRYFAGRDLLVVDTRTNRIVSIIPGVIP